MIHRHQHIADLSVLLRQMGVERIVISPGSRNAPLIASFYAEYGKNCSSIVDERSAGYVALGMARNLQKPVALISTSGTAVLNYSPAIAEAYYQRIPLVIITADRPQKWIDQQDNQTIRQKNVFRNFILQSLSLPEYFQAEKELDNTYTEIISTVKLSMELQGPVHINVPLDEPLYQNLPPFSIEPQEINLPSKSSVEIPAELIQHWKEAEKILIIHGQDVADAKLQRSIEDLFKDPRVVMIAENISNLDAEEIIDRPELMLWRTMAEELETPDLLIYAGGQIVSKKLKSLLRNRKIKNAWRIGIDLFEMDTFSQQNRFAKIPAHKVYNILSQFCKNETVVNFKNSWKKAFADALEATGKALKNLSFSDPLVIHTVFQQLPENAIVELGNSSVIRLAQLLPKPGKIRWNSNRGVSGIDGCLSAAVGAALTTDRPVVVILGDLSFVYDSNALWNRQLPSNLHIIVLNNAGGGLFGLIPGPDEHPAFREFFVTQHPVKISKLAEAFDLAYFYAENQQEHTKSIGDFFKRGKRPKLMEIKTDQIENKTAFCSLINRK